MILLKSGTCITSENHAAWLASRPYSLGASDCAAALGFNPYKSPLQVFSEKMGWIEGEPENKAMRRGKRRQAIVLDDYLEDEELTLADVQQEFFAIHSEYPFLTATYDALRWDEIAEGITRDPIPVEIKHVGRNSAIYWGFEDHQIPEHYLIQVHMQIACIGAKYAHVATEIAGEFRRFTVQRDEELLGYIYQVLGQFWDRIECERRGELSEYAIVNSNGEYQNAPLATTQRDIPVLARIRKKLHGEIELTEEQFAILQEYDKHKTAERNGKKAAEEFKLEILNFMGKNKVGVHGSWRLSVSIAHHPERIPKKPIKEHDVVTIRVTKPKGEQDGTDTDASEDDE